MIGKIIETIKLHKLYMLPKLVLAYIVYLLTCCFDQRSIVLVSEKLDEARDNGFYFFRYIKDNTDEKNVYYIIKKDSKDYSKIDIYKKDIIFLDSFKHYYYFFLCDKMVSSQAYAYPISKKLCQKVFRYRTKKLYWLQHGVTKDYDRERDYSQQGNVKLCCCASKREQYIFINEFHYPPTIAVNTGFCRFDGLRDTSDRNNPQILIMPTFRKWLTPKLYDYPTENEISRFVNSSYFKFYDGLLRSERLLKLLENNNIHVLFYLHYAFQPYAELFKGNKCVTIARKNDYDVQALMKESNFLITDFSSVAFDFAYMDKPLCYAHFDYEEYRLKHYGEGYFSYTNDGFGPVVTSIEEIINLLEDSCRNNFNVDRKYRDRTNAFFDRRDTENCKRVADIVFE